MSKSDESAETLYGLLICYLLDIDAKETINDIRQLFKKGCVDITCAGDLEEVEIELGFRTERSTPKPNLAQLYGMDEFSELQKPDSDDVLEVIDYYLMRYGHDDSILDVSELDGFFAALACAPNTIMPSRWMPAIWGGEALAPEWQNKKEIEAIFQKFIADHPDITVSILRPCFVVGPNFKNPLAEHLQKKLVMMPSNIKPWQFVHEDDVINVMGMMLEKRINGIFNVAGEGTMSFREMLKMLGNFMIPVPWFLMFPLNNLAWFLRLTFITKFPSPGMRMMVNPWIATSDQLKRETGYKFNYDTKSAI